MLCKTICKNEKKKLCKRWRDVIDEAGQVRRKKIERSLDPQKKRREVSTGSADKMQNVGRIREVSSVTKFPLPTRALPKFGFSEFTCDDALFQLSTAINHGQHVVPVGALTPFVHLLASEQLELLRLLPKWVNASRWRIMTVHHLSRFTDANPPPCLTFSHATCCP